MIVSYVMESTSLVPADVPQVAVVNAMQTSVIKQSNH